MLCILLSISLLLGKVVESKDLIGVSVAMSIFSPFNQVKEFDLLVNQNFNMRLWYVAFHKTRASCSSFFKLVCFLIAPMPYMCSNPRNILI